MKAHIEIKIRLAQLPNGGLHKILKKFSTQSGRWVFRRDRSEDYQLRHQGEAGFVTCEKTKGLEAASVALANIDKKHPKTFCLTNIIPEEKSALTLDQYNAIGSSVRPRFSPLASGE